MHGMITLTASDVLQGSSQTQTTCSLILKRRLRGGLQIVLDFFFFEHAMHTICKVLHYIIQCNAMQHITTRSTSKRVFLCMHLKRTALDGVCAAHAHNLHCTQHLFVCLTVSTAHNDTCSCLHTPARASNYSLIDPKLLEKRPTSRSHYFRSADVTYTVYS
jgi:hypothetical protein